MIGRASAAGRSETPGRQITQAFFPVT